MGAVHANAATRLPCARGARGSRVPAPEVPPPPELLVPRPRLLYTSVAACHASPAPGHVLAKARLMPAGSEPSLKTATAGVRPGSA